MKDLAHDKALTLPHFLIIGAMKAGTTTLYDDLLKQPGVAMPPEKEPEDLVNDHVLTDAGTRTYARRFTGLSGLLGEASTAYTKRPDFTGTPQRAHTLLGPELKLIYLLRDPVARMVSQYKHEYGMERETRPLNEALREEASYRDYSRYSWQLEPWLAQFGETNVLVLHFEEYVAKRREGLQQVCDFLGAGQVQSDPSGHRNASDGKAVTRRGSMAHRFAQSRLYQYGLKPMLGNAARDRLKGIVSRKVALPETKLDPELRAELETFFAKDTLAAEAMRRAKQARKG